MLEKFEIKVKEIKEKLGERRIAVISFCIFGITMLFGLQMANVYGRSRQTNSDTNNRTLYNMIGNVKNAEVYIEKLRVTTTKTQQISSFVEILSEVSLAKEHLSALPVNQDSMNNVSKFLTQVIDFSKYGIKKLTQEGLGENDYDILKSINESMIILTDTLDNIYDEIAKGSIKWDEVASVTEKGLENSSNILVGGVESIKNNFAEYEGLIYDGAYSSHLESTVPKLIQNMSEVSITEAKEKVKNAISTKYTANNMDAVDIYSIQYVGEINGKIALYEFKVLLEKSNNEITVQITKNGGLLYLMVQDRSVKEKTISDDEAKGIGKNYLKQMGVENMEATYTIEEANMITINYAPMINDTVIYTDLIKVKIAEDTGEVCSVECAGYIFNHHERENFSPSISEIDARSVLNEFIAVKSSRFSDNTK